MLIRGAVAIVATIWALVRCGMPCKPTDTCKWLHLVYLRYHEEVYTCIQTSHVL